LPEPDPNKRVPTSYGSITVAELEARCAVLEPGIVLLREIRGGTADSVEVLMNRALSLGAPFGAFSVVADLTEATERPKGRYLGLVRSFADRITHLAMVRPSRTFLLEVIRFIFSPRNTSVHPTLEAAITEARAALQRRREASA
jgi:hypothetical protein